MIRTSAASDARMGRAVLPAMSNSGSGNQGITATMVISSMIGDVVSGMICDGASNRCVRGSDGIISDDVDQSIANLCALAAGSMRHTDMQIIEIMAAKAC